MRTYAVRDTITERRKLTKGSSEKTGRYKTLARLEIVALKGKC